VWECSLGPVDQPAREFMRQLPGAGPCPATSSGVCSRHLGHNRRLSATCYARLMVIAAHIRIAGIIGFAHGRRRVRDAAREAIAAAKVKTPDWAGHEGCWAGRPRPSRSRHRGQRGGRRLANVGISKVGFPELCPPVRATIHAVQQAAFFRGMKAHGRGDGRN